MKTTTQKEHWIGIMMMKEISHINHLTFCLGQINVFIGNVMCVDIKVKLRQVFKATQGLCFRVINVQ